ncbi:grainyhead-like protein 1 homolog [Coregonus clupeaformis]|uniref:Grh/CP2 DB domain-containing protein n=1 Tax=Coregonus suidteri TaxID=861788 RepID=A0AAN8KNR6_9TELE|nr:grainyhead-like protein 1 homolog [Coregonus clupeaformis]
MTQELVKKRGVLVFQNEPSYSGGQRQALMEDDEEWRTFLENPLTAASKAMMDINGDEDSANAPLYNYYKVPRDKRTTGQPKTEVIVGDADPNKMNFMVPLQDSPLAMTTLRTVPRNTAAQGSSQPSRRDKTRALYPASNSIVCLSTTSTSSPPPYSFSPEGTLALHSFPVCSPPGSQSSQSDGMAFSRQLNHSQYSPRAQSLTPDSTYTESYKDSSNEVFPLSEEVQLRMASIPPGGYPYYRSTVSQHFEYILEAPQSLWPKSSSGQMSYLNKCQFYPITLRALGGTPVPPHLSGEVRSVVMLVFGEEKLTEDQLKNWKYWHSRQHTAKQRCIDIADYKERFNTIANIEEIAYNGISFTWDTKDEPRVFVSVNCLSTDFSPQKGVRGLPLNLQIDTYSFGSHGHKLVHRAYCQIKVFCDKGAERKIRDEERKHPRRKGKRQETTAAYVEDPLQLKHVAITSFKAMSDMDSQPVLFIPEVHFPSTQHHHACLSDDGEDSLGQKRLLYYDEDFELAPHKRARGDGPEKVLLYVRKETEEVFDALMLRTPTLAGLLEAVTDKYELPLEKMGKVYKRCKKGILVHMDDNIIKHYSNEDAFQINMQEVGGKMLLTLTEI